MFECLVVQLVKTLELAASLADLQCARAACLADLQFARAEIAELTRLLGSGHRAHQCKQPKQSCKSMQGCTKRAVPILLRMSRQRIKPGLKQWRSS